MATARVGLRCSNVPGFFNIHVDGGKRRRRGGVTYSHWKDEGKRWAVVNYKGDEVGEFASQEAAICWLEKRLEERPR